jgi:hypothetical protein
VRRDENSMIHNEVHEIRICATNIFFNRTSRSLIDCHNNEDGQRNDSSPCFMG